MKYPDVALRPAVAADIPLLRRWDTEPHVIESDPNDDWQWETEIGREVDWREQLIAEVDGRAIGYLEIIDPAREEQHYWGDCAPDLCAIDIWIGEPDALGQGYGTEMMRQALARCFADARVNAVLVDPLASNERARRFYERIGFRFVEDRQFGADACAVYRIGRADYRAWSSRPAARACSRPRTA